MKHEPQTDFRTPPPAAPATKKPKLARDPNDIKRKATPKASSATSPTTSRGTLSIADKRAIMEKGMEVLAKQLPFKELSEQVSRSNEAADISLALPKLA